MEFSSDLDQSVDKIQWPVNLTHLMFGGDVNLLDDKSQWTVNFTHLTVSGDFDQPDVQWPVNLTHLTFDDSFNPTVYTIQTLMTMFTLKF